MKQIDNETNEHAVTFASDDGKWTLILVRGPEPFLWISDSYSDINILFGENNEALKALAKAILKEVKYGHETTELLAALNGLVELIDAHGWGEGPALRNARAAIVKAKGESNG